MKGFFSYTASTISIEPGEKHFAWLQLLGYIVIEVFNRRVVKYAEQKQGDNNTKSGRTSLRSKVPSCPPSRDSVPPYVASQSDGQQLLSGP